MCVLDESAANSCPWIACQAELLPVIRSYVRLRQSIQLDAQCAETQAYGHGSQAHHRLSSRSSSVAPDPGIQLANTYVSGELGEQQPNGKLPSRVFPMHRTAHKEEDFDVTIDNVASQLSNSPQRGRAADLESKTTLQDTSNQNVNSRSQSGATRTQGVRETDATVPKSVPFPPRPKPKTTRELLTRISFLTGELLRASEEKLGLATAAYDSVRPSFVYHHYTDAYNNRLTGTSEHWMQQLGNTRIQLYQDLENVRSLWGKSRNKGMMRLSMKKRVTMTTNLS